MIGFFMREYGAITTNWLEDGHGEWRRGLSESYPWRKRSKSRLTRPKCLHNIVSARAIPGKAFRMIFS